MFSRNLRLSLFSEDRSVADQICQSASRSFLRFTIDSYPLQSSAAILRPSEKPNVVLLDARRDVSRAAEFVRRMREHSITRTIPVIYLVRQVDKELLEALQSHSTDFLVLPQDAAEFAARVTTVLRFCDALRRMEQQNKALAHLAAYDDLTGVYNRRYLIKSMEDGLANLQPGQPRDLGLGVFLIDLDNFKEVNDTCGHLAGDRVLVEFARLLTSCIRGADIVGRIGGDEFCIVAPNTSRELCVAMARRAVLCINEQRFGPGPDCNLHVTASIGVAIAPYGTAQTTSDVLAEADLALYEAKDGGRNTFHVRTMENLQMAYRAGESAAQ